MKKGLFLFAIIFSFIAFSCSSDDDKGSTSKEITLIGEWRLTNIDFTVFEEGGMPASDACIFELIAGFEFSADSKFYYHLGEDYPLFDPYAEDYWSWEGNINDFKIIQNNPSSPGYNFGLTPTDINSEWVDGVATLTFHAEMFNGSEAKFTLIKKEVDSTKTPILTKPDGSVYRCGFFD